MAEFNPQVSPVQSDNYTTRSQGQTPNKAFAYLFGGIADAVTSFKASQKDAKAAKDEQMKLDFGNDVGAGWSGDVSQPTTRHVGGAGSAPVNFVTEEAKSDIDGSLGSLVKLKDGVNQGTVTKLYFDQMRMAKVKDLIVKYPQLSRSYIEKAVDEAMGNSSAVAYRTHLAELQDEQNKYASDEEKRVKAQKAKWAEDGYLDPNSEVAIHYKELTGTDLNPLGDINEDAMNIAISSEVNIDKVMAREEAKMRFSKSKGEALEREAEISATSVMQTATQKLFYTAMNADKARIQYLMRRGKDITPQETQELLGKMSEMEGQLNLAADGIVGKYATYIRDPKKREDIKQVMLGPFATMKRLVEDKNFGVLNAVSNYTSAVKADKGLAFELKNGDFVQNLDLATKKYGSDAVNKFFDPSVNLGLATMDDGQRALFDKISLDIYGGNKPVADVLGDIKKSLTQKDANVVFLAIQRAINGGLAPEVSKQQAAEYFGKTLFAPEGINILRGMQDPGRVLSMFVNPAMTEKLKGTTTWDEYRDFAMDQASIVMKPVGDTIIDTQKYTYRGVVNYDEKSGKFSLDTQGVGADPIDFRATQNGQKAVAQMNAYMDAMKPILEAEGITPDQFLSGVMIGKDYKKVAKEGSMLQRMGTALYDFVQGQKLEEGKKTPRATPGVRGERTDNPPPYDFFQSLEGPTGPHNSIEGHSGVSRYRPTDKIQTRSPILNLIGAAEGADFNTMFGGGKHDLANKTVAEVLDLQKQNVKTKGGSPAGAMQVTDDTLKGLIKKGVVKLSDKFDQFTQEKIGHALLERRGYSKFISGEITVEEFADNLAKEWASLPLASGLSAYQGVAGNKARISREQLIKTLEQLRQ